MQIELRLPAPPDLAALRSAFAGLGIGEVKVQSVGSGNDVLITRDLRANSEAQMRATRKMLANRFQGTEIRRVDAVGATVSAELYRNGLIATGLALLGVLVYISFRFGWPFGVGVVATLLLDATKTIGFLALTQLQFDLNRRLQSCY